MAIRQVRIGSMSDIHQYDDAVYGEAIDTDNQPIKMGQSAAADHAVRRDELPGAADIVSASANIGDNEVVRGDGGAKGVQGSNVSISDSGSITLLAGETIDGRDPSVDGAKLDAIENGAEVNEIDGDGTTGRVLRQSSLKIDDGTNADTLECELSSLWNGDADGPTDNVAKGATTGNYTLDAAGEELKIEAAALSGNALMAQATLTINPSGTVVTLNTYISSNDIVIELRNASSGALQDITALVDVGAPIYITILYLTDA